MKIYVGNISRESTEDEVKELFTKFGTVENIKLIRDINTDQLKGFGFIDMPDDEAAKKAIDELNGSNFKERPLTVSVANPNVADRKKKPVNKGKSSGSFSKSKNSTYGKSSGGYGKSNSGGYGKNNGGQNRGNSYNKNGNKSNGNVNGNREGGNEISGFNYNNYNNY